MISRRRFLLLLGGGAGAAACGLLRPRGLQAVTRTSRALGARVSMTALHEDREAAEQALEAAFEELERVESVLSLYRPQSQLSLLNRYGVLLRPHSFILEVLGKAQETARASGGAFDVTVQPLWELYATAARNGALPGEEEVGAARLRVNWRRLRVSPEEVRLDPGMAVTLNGIAQGYATDRALAVLRTHGVQAALVDAGELAATGRKPDGSPWTAGIQHPRRPDAWIDVAKLEDRCLATSGDYATSFNEDRSANHVFDPVTGRSPGHFSSVTIAARTGMEADALSTAVFVMGPERGMELVEATEGADAYIVTKDGRTLATGGFPL
ncbi:MAG: FAD:protein FMN transferase [Planctomycetes bacterium]|nr:FAD:protein FMN transferase [Planctomycetota bacterium]